MVNLSRYLAQAMTERERDETGKFTEKVSLDDVLSMFNGEPLTATEIAETLEISNKSALNKLDKLHKEGQINRKQVGARAVVWWRNDEDST